MVLRFFLNRTEQNGFTLIELIAVLSIASIILTISIPVMHSTLLNHKIEMSAAKIGSDIRLIQQISVSEGIFYRIKFNPYSESYSILCRTNEDIKTLPDGIDLVTTSFNNHTLTFSLTGAPTPAGSVMLRDLNGNYRYVIVAVATGRVRVSKNPPE